MNLGVNGMEVKKIDIFCNFLLLLFLCVFMFYVLLFVFVSFFLCKFRVRCQVVSRGGVGGVGGVRHGMAGGRSLWRLIYEGNPYMSGSGLAA